MLLRSTEETCPCSSSCKSQGQSVSKTKIVGKRARSHVCRALSVGLFSSARCSCASNGTGIMHQWFKPRIPQSTFAETVCYAGALSHHISWNRKEEDHSPPVRNPLWFLKYARRCGRNHLVKLCAFRISDEDKIGVRLRVKFAAPTKTSKQSDGPRPCG